jgi:hypothetical protein
MEQKELLRIIIGEPQVETVKMDQINQGEDHMDHQQSQLFKGSSNNLAPRPKTHQETFA